MCILALLSACSPQEQAGRDDADVTDSDRASWVVSELGSVNGWMSEELRAEKYGKMSASAFAFYRGSNHLYWADFAGDERLATYGGNATTIWIQGDLHVANFGAFHNDEDKIVFDLNDFDEAVVADYQLDLWRAATSLVLVANENGLPQSTAKAGVVAFTQHYLEQAATYRGNDDEKHARWDSTRASGKLQSFLTKVATKESRAKMLGKWTLLEGQERKLNTGIDKLAPVSDALAGDIVEALPKYGKTLEGGLSYQASYFKVRPGGVAQRLHAGVGSLGVARYYVLIDGPTEAPEDDVLLDVKLMPKPTALSYLPELRYLFHNHAQRAAIAQRALGDAVDDHLGWLTLDDDNYLVRERSPYKEAFPTKKLSDEARFVELAEQWGSILATAHCRADSDFDASFVSHSFDKQLTKAVAHKHEPFGALVWKVAESYATQVERDYQAFLPLAPTP